MSGPDTVSTNVFGANVPTSTGAAGTGGHADGGKDQVNTSGAPTTDLSSPTPHSFEQSASGVVAGLGSHDGVADAAAHGHLPAGQQSTDTGASGSTSVSHAHNGTHVVSNPQTGV